MKKNQKGFSLIELLFIIIIIVLLTLVGIVVYRRVNDPYSKLKQESYNQNGLSFSFSYPAIMQPDPTLLNQLNSQNNQNTSAEVGYSYAVDSYKVGIIEYHYDIGVVLGQLDLTPAQLLSQIKNKSGSFIDNMNQNQPHGLDPACSGSDTSITTTSGQTDILCVNTDSEMTANGPLTQAVVIGANTAYQYSLRLFMPTSIWSAHQQVWQQVEKSFSYD